MIQIQLTPRGAKRLLTVLREFQADQETYLENGWLDRRDTYRQRCKIADADEIAVQLERALKAETAETAPHAIVDQAFRLLEAWAMGDTDAMARLTNGLFDLLKQHDPSRFHHTFQAAARGKEQA